MREIVEEETKREPELIFRERFKRDIDEARKQEGRPLEEVIERLRKKLSTKDVVRAVRETREER